MADVTENMLINMLLHTQAALIYSCHKKVCEITLTGWPEFAVWCPQLCCVKKKSNSLWAKSWVNNDAAFSAWSVLKSGNVLNI